MLVYGEFKIKMCFKNMRLSQEQYAEPRGDTRIALPQWSVGHVSR